MDEGINRRLGELIFDLAKGDKEALSSIYMIMCKILYAVGNIYFNQKEDIEDLIQDLLLTLYDKAKKFNRNNNAYAWIVAIYKNLIKNKLRRRKREENYILEELENKILFPETNDTYLENHVFLNDILSKLTQYEHKLVLYRIIGGCSIGDVAKIMNKPKSTIESQLKVLENKIKKF